MIRRNIRGCQLLDHFSDVSTGIPIVAQVLDRILLRLRVVFLKQVFGWMVFGELQDNSSEFFIQSLDSSSSSTSTSFRADTEEEEGDLLTRVTQQLYRASHASSGQSLPSSFDWTTSFSLRFNTLPESHVTPRMASQIMFAGKAVHLLMAGTSTSPGSDQAFRYLSAGSGDPPPSVTTSSAAFPSEEVDRFSLMFRQILVHPGKACEMLRAAVETIHSSICRRLWGLLREGGFLSFIQVSRCTTSFPHLNTDVMY